MFRKSIAALALLVAGVIGDTALHAQAPTADSPVYLIAHVQVTEPNGWTEYLKALPATLAPFHAKTLARAVPITMDSSTPPAGATAIIVFDNYEELRKWWNSPAYQAIVPLREKSAKTVVYAVPGLPPAN